MNKQDYIKLIHNNISNVLCTTEEFNLKDSENLLDELVREGVISFKEERYRWAYRNFVNQIDDYFEYSNESLKDRKKVHQLLENLTDKLVGIEESNND